MFISLQKRNVVQVFGEVEKENEVRAQRCVVLVLVIKKL